MIRPAPPGKLGRGIGHLECPHPMAIARRWCLPCHGPGRAAPATRPLRSGAVTRRVLLRHLRGDVDRVVGAVVDDRREGEEDPARRGGAHEREGVVDAPGGQLVLEELVELD